MPKSSKHIPNHVAIVCDGNRRWARQRGWEVFRGHEYAVDKVLEPLIDRSIEHSIQVLTFWIFSTENWRRDKVEVDFLMNLFRRYFKEDAQKLHDKGVKITTIGDITAFPQDIQDEINQLKTKTSDNKNMTVTLAMNYGGRDEIVRATRSLIADNLHDLQTASSETEQAKILQKIITKDSIADHLDTSNLPDPDLIIRTGGEHRTSGYLLWQSEYAEYAFPKFYFPEFTPERLDQVLEEFALRQRRFGK